MPWGALPRAALGNRTMLLWLAFALMTAATLALVLRPLAAAVATAPEPPGDPGAIAVYRDQLVEIEAQRAQGMLEPAEAEAARIEISRRLLAAAEGVPASAAGKPERVGRLALPIAAAVPLFALVVYLAYGSPGMPGQPHAAIVAARPQAAQIGELVARVEARLREAPQDGKGWDVIAPVYFKLGRFRDAQNAYQQANRILGESVARLAGFAEASVFAADGIVTEEARRAYTRILELEPGRIEARFWLALAREQDGDLAGAKVEYDSLVAEAPADAPWREAVAERARVVASRLSPPAGARPVPGPGADDIAAAQRMAPAERQRMIEGMVEGLAQRLKSNGRDLAGWQRLVRAYTVLERTDDAKSALAEARRIFAGDAPAMAELSKLAASMGLGS